MKRIYYSGGSILTGDAIAEAVLLYASALAKSPLSDVVHIPIVLPGTEGAIAGLLIGPASQVMCVPSDEGGDSELIDDELVVELERRTLMIGSPRPVPQSREGVVVGADDYE